MSEQGAVAVCSICPHHCRLREGEVGRCRATDLPLHLTRYFPRYRLGLPPTSRATLERLREVARQSLRFVHLGNV